MTLFNDKYRVESARLKGWDYTKSAAYYVTICTQGKENFFGKIENDIMNLSEVGEIVKEEWLKTELIRKYVYLDEFVVMPNHFHGIIMIINDERDRNTSIQNETAHRAVSTNDLLSTAILQADSLGSIIGQFKSVCTKRIREKYNARFEWQERFFDRVIRDENEMNNIREYIHYNPVRWHTDKFFS